ncbi:hypothetical protein BW723_04565 [Polaribacter reichenbachii]|uniref:Uncharacterized protein n=1 Tax=Polaribacter reichenbachii TaxID=996801 RepID=A0A1B8TUV0_9FLAO|nr:hypothetical protein [Polaribacter reichenbachii]APZ45613.1 hypothetical protein BW723_04565 [Polaribacter reichenbachii]AUC19475.1 hypothetical protein BTO17_12570 [Polaribacter reichenbachii]OBY63370.1 hypothetical protein LPB301_11145 [Polaribacter reichenbachii]
MKKKTRISFIIISAALFFLNLFTLLFEYDLYTKNIIRNVDIKIHLIFGVLSFSSGIFNLVKILPEKKFNIKLHNLFRIGDFGFASFLLIFFLIGIIKFINKIIANTVLLKDFYILIIVYVAITYCFYLVTDNLKFQKQIEKRKQFQKQQLINEIGK